MANRFGKVSKHLGIQFGSEGADRGLGDWHEHLLLLNRRQHALFSHDLTCYVLFLPGLCAAQFAELGLWHQELFLATLVTQG